MSWIISPLMREGQNFNKKREHVNVICALIEGWERCLQRFGRSIYSRFVEVLICNSTFPLYFREIVIFKIYDAKFPVHGRHATQMALRETTWLLKMMKTHSYIGSSRTYTVLRLPNVQWKTSQRFAVHILGIVIFTFGLLILCTGLTCLSHALLIIVCVTFRTRNVQTEKRFYSFLGWLLRCNWWRVQWHWMCGARARFGSVLQIYELCWCSRSFVHPKCALGEHSKKRVHTSMCTFD